MAEISNDARDAIIDALREQQKITAIKHYREATGAGLREAKGFVEQLQTSLHEESPDEFPKPSTSGCAVVLFFAVIGIGGLFVF